MTEENNVSGDHSQEAAVPPEAVADQVQAGQSDQREQSDQNQSVPLSALQSERAKRQQMEDELRMIKDHLALSQVKQPVTQKQKDDFEGLDDGDVMTVGEFKKLSGSMANKFKMTIEELKMAQKHPDYQEVITKYLPDVLKQNPGLQNTLQTTQDYELAYYLAKNSENYRSEKRQSKKSADAQRIVENANRAGSLSSMGSTSPISQAKKWKDMSDSEFKQAVSRHLG